MTEMVLTLLTAAGAAAEQKDGLAALKGAWAVQQAGYGGRDTWPEELRKTFRDTVEGDRWTTFKNGEKTATWKLVVDAGKEPKQIDFLTEDGKTVIMRGIYELKGDTLTVLWSAGGPRPTAFKDPGPMAFLKVFKRAKD